MSVLHGKVREQVKKPHWTTLIIIDSQAVKNTYNASVESKGFCFYKATNGILIGIWLLTPLGFPSLRTALNLLKMHAIAIPTLKSATSCKKCKNMKKSPFSLLLACCTKREAIAQDSVS
ncbi:hypothetical protein PQG02_11420 [Nostoc sp. UHCC 0926]|uniref:hypothetical protein n=1 Tax=unclassified Nostoc TaxID=2593658 RepID=UPI00236239DB|nr:hypothetical protein [Nostoc sp. UHCC 0926]WDD34880.1 hypothetical protein PQG02_11420 [Nostoc sp. UHCC 0926]